MRSCALGPLDRMGKRTRVRGGGGGAPSCLSCVSQLRVARRLTQGGSKQDKYYIGNGWTWEMLVQWGMRSGKRTGVGGGNGCRAACGRAEIWVRDRAYFFAGSALPEFRWGGVWARPVPQPITLGSARLLTALTCGSHKRHLFLGAPDPLHAKLIVEDGRAQRSPFATPNVPGIAPPG